MYWKLTAAFVILCCVLGTSQETAAGANQMKGAAISGTVTRADTHLPVKNVQVSVMGRTDSASDSADAEETDLTQVYQSSANTDEKGHFAFFDLAPGTYYVTASHTGMVLKGTHPRSRLLVKLEAGQSQSLTLMMLPGGAITGRVLNEEGEPMQNVSVVAMHYVYTVAGRRLAEAKRVTSDDKGEYRLFSLKPGSYVLLADTGRSSYEDGGFAMALGTHTRAGGGKQDQKIYAPTYYQNQSSAEQASPVILKPGDETQANFTLARVSAHHITGKITGVGPPKSADKPEEFRCFVSARRAGSQFPVGFALIGKDSSFDIGPVVPGKYRITAVEQESDNNISGSKDVVVSSSDVTGVTIA